MAHWDEEVDVVVLGSGAAGLTAALTAAVHGASVAIYEKAATVGGTTAVSGGIVWTPAHHRSPDVDLPVEDALTYLRAQALGAMDEELVATFVRTGEPMIDFSSATAMRASKSPRVTWITSRNCPAVRRSAAGR